ncbi:MAG: hypothetical protein SFX19_00085 [Alphaproteobacteria bacterium]|nr:hypothetical protein [Alphaproteobacteria bacterium]
MRLRTFTAGSMPEAFALVKEALGEDAIILSTEEKKDGVHITAAIDADSPLPSRGRDGVGASTKNRTKNAPLLTSPLMGEGVRYDVQHALRFHNVPELFISKMSAQLNDAAIASILGKGRMNIANENRHFLKLALEQVCGNFFQFDPMPDAPQRLMIAGSPGIGKTLAIAKLATRYALAKEALVVITTDTHRAGGATQLQSFTDILGIPLAVCADKKSLATALKRAGKDTYVLIDTAGCNPYEEDALAELAGMADAAHAKVVLALPAGLDVQETIDLTEAFMALPVAELIATRTDCARRFGGLLAAAAAYKLPFAMESGSASVTDAVSALTAKTLVQHLLKPL